MERPQPVRRLGERGPDRRWEREAVRAGQQLTAHGLLPGVVHTSLQQRAIRTADLALTACDRDWIPVRRSWQLNSNHCGALQGRNKAEVQAEAGERQFMAWRRAYDEAPLPVGISAGYSQFADARYWYDAIVPDLRTGACVLVVSHGNTLRALKSISTG